MARVAFATSSQVACASSAMTWTRGVITFSAVRSARFRVRMNSSAVSASRAPSLAEWRASATSSCGPRAEASSSAGSMPMRRTARFAVLFRCVMKGRNAALNRRWGVATRLATASGDEIAQFLGTSSPTTIRKTVDRAVPMTSAAEAAAVPGEPETLQGARDQLGDGRLGEHADDQIGHGDAELGAGELEGQVPYGLEGAGGAPLTALDGALEARSARRW